MPNIFYVDYEAGSDASDGLSFATRKKTIPSANTASSPGDTIRVMASPDPTSIGSATWNNLSKTVTLASALNKNVSLCENAWTAAINVTASASTTRKEGGFSSSLAIAAGFISGQVARESFAAQDFSAYKQVSFWIRTNLAIAASTLELRLCSDALGVVTVNTIPIPAIPNLNLWTSITFDNGAALGASIQSVVLQALSDPGTVTILLDNIVACKDSTSADALCLNSLISKNTATETWYAIQSINGTTVLLDMNPDASATLGRGYYGDTETVTTYKRNPIPTDLSTATSAFIMTKAGSYGLPITISGGWNRTDMTTRTGETFYTGRNGSIEGIRTAVLSFFSFDRLCFVKYTAGYQLNSGNNIHISNTHSNNHTSFGIIATANFCTLSNGFFCNTGSTGFSMAGHAWTITDCVFSNNVSQGIQLSGSFESYFKNINCFNSGGRGVYNIDSNPVFENLTTDKNGLEGTRCDQSSMLLINANLFETTQANVSQTPFAKNKIFSQKHGGDSNDNRTFTDIGLIKSVADADRHTLSGLAWKFSPTSNSAVSEYPLSMNGIKIACDAGTLVTVSVWVKRSNTGITARLFVKGGQIAGVPADVSASASGVAGVYEQISISFTPSEIGVVDVELHAFGGTTFSAWFDDISISQV